MNWPLTILGAIGVTEVFVDVARYRRRQEAYILAARRALVLNRPLVVVGDPDSGGHTRLIRAYGCGDLCVDLHGCDACPRHIAVDLSGGRIDLPDDSAVVYVACTLEYVPDIQSALTELRRVAGQELYIVTVDPWTLTGTLWPGAKWGYYDGQWQPVTAARKAAYVGTLGLLSYLAWRYMSGWGC